MRLEARENFRPVNPAACEALSPNRLAHRGLKPAAVLAANRPHGDRLRYMGGCKCAECRRANSRYEQKRQKARRNGDWNGIVSAARARRHIMKLSRRNVGRLAVAAASDVAKTVICEIRSGKKRQIRARTERRILAVGVDMASDHALTPAKKSWRLVGRLIAEGYKKAWIAREMGQRSPGLQLGKNRVLVRTAFRVEKMFHRLKGRLIRP